MVYGKIVNNSLQIAPRKVIWHGMRVFNPSPAKLAELGYKPVVFTDEPGEPPEGYHYEETWTETETDIEEGWVLVADTPE